MCSRRLVETCLIALILVMNSRVGVVLPVFAQVLEPIPSRQIEAGVLPSTTFEGSSLGGWAGPCDSSWATSDFPYNAMRVCRVATYLARSFGNNVDPSVAEEFANKMFRICWGTFPKAGRDCKQANAWAPWRAWVNFAARGAQGPPPPPIVITLQASEFLQSDDELAAILSHEMGHAFDPEQRLDQFVEQRADSLSIGFMIKAGYDARSAGRALQMITLERGQGAVGNLLWTLLNHVNQVATQDAHGFTSDRIYRMKEVFAKGCAALSNQPIGCKGGWR